MSCDMLGGGVELGQLSNPLSLHTVYKSISPMPPKTSHRSIVRRKLHAQLEAYLCINGIDASNGPSTLSVHLRLPDRHGNRTLAPLMLMSWVASVCRDCPNNPSCLGFREV